MCLVNKQFFKRILTFKLCPALKGVIAVISGLITSRIALSGINRFGILQNED